MKMGLNVEQAAVYIERDGARFIELRDGAYVYGGTLLTVGTYTFKVREGREKAELDAARDRYTARQRARFISTGGVR